MYMLIRPALETANRLTFALSIGALLCLPAQAATQQWSTLTSKQQEALAPLSLQWDSLPEKQQIRLLATSKHFHQLSTEKKQRYLKNLTEWIKLTPEQRNRAREKYKAFKKVSPDKRDEVKRMVLQKEAEKEITYAPSYKDETPSSEDSDK